MGKTDDDVLWLEGPATPRRQARSNEGTVSWSQVQAFLEMAELALKAKTQATEKLAEQVSSTQKDLARALEDLSKGRTSNFLYLADSDSLLTAALTEKTRELAFINQLASQLEAQRNDLEGQLKLAQDALEERDAQLEGSRSESSYLQDSLHSVQMEKGALQAAIVHLQQEKDIMEAAISSLREEGSSQAALVSSVQAEKESLEATFSKLQIEHDRLEATVSRQQTGTATQAKGYWAVDADKLMDENRKLKEQIASLQHANQLSRANGEYLGKCTKDGVSKENRSPAQQRSAAKHRPIGPASPTRSRSALGQPSEQAGSDGEEGPAVNVNLLDETYDEPSSSDFSSDPLLEGTVPINVASSAGSQELLETPTKEETEGHEGENSFTPDNKTYSSATSAVSFEPVKAN